MLFDTEREAIFGLGEQSLLLWSNLIMCIRSASSVGYGLPMSSVTSATNWFWTQATVKCYDVAICRSQTAPFGVTKFMDLSKPTTDPGGTWGIHLTLMQLWIMDARQMELQIGQLIWWMDSPSSHDQWVYPRYHQPLHSPRENQ